MKTTTRFARAVMAAAFLFAAGALAQAVQAGPPAPPPGSINTPPPKILVIDRSAVLRGSKVGQDIVRQVNAYTVQAEKDLKGQGAALRQQYQALQQQLAILSADVKSKRMKDFDAKRASLEALAQKKQSLIQGGFFKARQQIEVALGPILQGIMKERGANLLLDRNAVVLGTVNVDVTGVAIQRLDQKMPSLKVDLVPPPPGMMQQQQQAAQQ